ncbi:kelch repeat and BTB domain-containing protein 4 isoform X3 [Ranitomeya variabilis]|uniref:kelch repeat and BTB domain-containing protein 4 isoform X3 n=1 Tax=Ranitomeya variabilis TaxID=490064 RepID=UPI004055C470
MDPSEEAAAAQNLAGTTEENYFVTYTFTDRSHSSRVAQSIMKLCMEEQLFADVTILVEGKEFQLHRLVLSAQSCFFRSMFASNLKEGRNRVIELQDVSASVFQLLVDYIYHGTVKLRLEELQETYEVADMYQLISLFEECSRFLVRTVQVKNCLQIMWLADQHSDTSLYTAAKHCAKTHLSQLCDSEEFLNLPLRLLTDILGDGVPCSQNPSAAIKSWIHYNKEEREGFSEVLISSLKESSEEYEEAPDRKHAAMIPVERGCPREFRAQLQKRVKEQNLRTPWCFQNDPLWGLGEERPHPTPDPEGRLQNTNWCQCGHCSIMPHVAESVCCREVPAINRFLENESCVTRHVDFAGFVLSRDFLVQMLQFSTKLTASKFAEKENGHLREAAYRRFTNMIYGFLGNGSGLSVPSCVVRNIRETFPSPDGNYTSYKWYWEYVSGPLADMAF